MTNRFRIIACVLLCALAAALCPVKSASAQPIPFAFWKRSGGGDSCSGACGTVPAGTVCEDGTVYVDCTLRTPSVDLMERKAVWDKNFRKQYIGAVDEDDGRNNIAAMKLISPDLRIFRAALYCENLTDNGYDDWYLPAKNELKRLFIAMGTDWPVPLYTYQEMLDSNLNVTGTAIYVNSILPRSNEAFCSSTEINERKLVAQHFRTGIIGYPDKSFAFFVRCVRRP